MAGRNHSIIIDTSVKNGYNMKPNSYGSNYQRIVAANKEAKKMGISYGKYMAELWEKHDRPPIEFGNFNKYAKPSNKAQQKNALKVLEGVEAAEYIKQLKIKAGTWEEPKTNNNKSQESRASVNKEWMDACKKLMPYREQLKNVYLAEEKCNGKEKK